MTRTITAIALALGMFAALSTPSHAALSNTDRTAAPAQTQATVEANASPSFATDAPAATTAATTPAIAKAAPVVTAQPQKAIIQKAKAQIASTPRFAASSRYGYPCH